MTIWLKTALRVVVLPILGKLSTHLEKKAAETPSKVDDQLAESLRVVMNALKVGTVFL